MEVRGSRSQTPVKRNYEEELRGVFTAEESVGGNRSPTRNGRDVAGVRQSDTQENVLAFKQRLIDQEQTFESEKFKLVHDFTLKLREEERYRVDLLSKVAELEGIKLRLEKELFEGLSSGRFQSMNSAIIDELKDRIDQLSEENRGLRGELQRRNDGESRMDNDRTRVQMRILDRELKLKQEDIQKLEKSLMSQQHETRFLQEELTKLESDMSEMRKEHSQTERENANLRMETQRLNAENNRLLSRLREITDESIEIRPKDYLALQQRLEDTTLRIKSLEEQIVQTSENYEELRQHASVTTAETVRRGKPRCESRTCCDARNRSKSRGSGKTGGRNGSEKATRGGGSKRNSSRRAVPM